MGWGDTEEEEATVQLLPPPKTQGALCSLDGRLITPALCGFGGGAYARTWHILQSVGAPPAPPPAARRGEGL